MEIDSIFCQKIHGYRTNRGKSETPEIQERAFEHFAREKYAKVYCWWSGAFFDFGFMVKWRSTHSLCHRHRFCDTHRSSFAAHVIPKPNSTETISTMIPRESWRFRKDYPLRISLANRSSSYWLFHSSSRCLSRQEKWFRAKSYQSSYIIVLFAVIKQITFLCVRFYI